MQSLVTGSDSIFAPYNTRVGEWMTRIEERVSSIIMELIFVTREDKVAVTPPPTEMRTLMQQRIACLLTLKLMQRQKKTGVIFPDDIVRHITVTYFSIPKYTHISTITGYDDTGITCMLIHENKIYSGNEDSTIKVWNMKTRELITTLAGHTDEILQNGFGFGVWCMLVHANKLYCGGGDDPVRIWNINTQLHEHEHFTSLMGHIGTHCMIVHDNKFYSGSQNKTIKVCHVNIVDGEGTTQTLFGHSGAVQCLQAQGKRLFSGSSDMTIKVWDTDNLDQLATLRGHGGEVMCMLQHGDRLYSGGRDKTIMVWNNSTYETLASLRQEEEANLRCADSNYVRACMRRGYRNDVRCMIFHNNMLYACGEGNNISVWDTEHDELLGYLESHTGAVACLLLHDDKLYSGSKDRTVKVWNTSSHELIATLTGHTGNVNCLLAHENLLYSASSGGWNNSIRINQIKKQAK